LQRTVAQLQDEAEERRRAEAGLKVSHHFLEIMNRHTSISTLLQEMVSELKELTGCVAVGVRILDDKKNIPYQAYLGFSKEFYDLESPLSLTDQCMCINVIKGTTDPGLPFYTPTGSFYMNGTTRFLATVSDADQGQTRNACNAFGYESVALVPIRLGEEILGLIHLADPREDMVFRGKVELVEWIALQLGTALQRITSVEAVRKQAQLLELAHDAIIVRDLDSRVVFWNRGAEETYGWTREQAEGQVTHALLRTQFPAAGSWEVIQQHLLQEGQWYGELVHTRADGDTIVTASRQMLQRNDAGQPVAILEINRNISGRKAAEDNLRRHSAMLASINRVFREALTCETESELGLACLRVAQDLTGSPLGFIDEVNPSGKLDAIAVNACSGEFGTMTQEHLLALRNVPVRGYIQEVLSRGQAWIAASREERPPPAGHPAITAFLGVPLKLAGQTIGLIGLANKPGGYTLADQEVTESLAVAVVEALMRFRAESKAARFSRLYRLLSRANEAIVRLHDRDALFRQICRIAVEEGWFRLTWIGMVDEAENAVRAVAQHGVDAGYLERLKIPLEEVAESRGPTGTAARTGRYDICNDIANDPRMAPWRDGALQRGFRSSGAFPLRIGARLVGTLTLYAGEPDFFTTEEISLLESLALDVSFAMESMEREADRKLAETALKDSEERLRSLASQLISAQEAERRRLALELHDDLGQSLMVLKMQLRAILGLASPDQEDIRSQCTTTLNYINEIIENIRRLARDLRPSLLEDLGLAAALRHLAETFRTYHNINILLDFDDITGLFSPAEEINIYRTSQESLTNIAKYARATQVKFAVKRRDGGVAFQVEDNGKGFDMGQVLVGEAARNSLGLAAMRERVRILGGALEIWSQPGQGTKVSFWVPVRQGER
jgi:PAS domain S-box-containing protein